MLSSNRLWHFFLGATCIGLIGAPLALAISEGCASTCHPDTSDHDTPRGEPCCPQGTANNCCDIDSDVECCQCDCDDGPLHVGDITYSPLPEATCEGCLSCEYETGCLDDCASDTCHDLTVCLRHCFPGLSSCFAA